VAGFGEWLVHFRAAVKKRRQTFSKKTAPVNKLRHATKLSSFIDGTAPKYPPKNCR
jgi:hypothetical protein